MIFSSRRRKDSDPHLLWKVRLFFLGAALALLGIGMESSLLVGLAIGALFLGIILRFLPARGDAPPSGSGEEQEEEEEEREEGENGAGGEEGAQEVRRNSRE